MQHWAVVLNMVLSCCVTHFSLFFIGTEKGQRELILNIQSSMVGISRWINCWDKCRVSHLNSLPYSFPWWLKQILGLQNQKKVSCKQYRQKGWLISLFFAFSAPVVLISVFSTFSAPVVPAVLAVSAAWPWLLTRLCRCHGLPVAAAGPDGHIPCAWLPPLWHLPPGCGLRAPP